ncbi:hypothetical protein Sango_2149700 [Sesamum angolense]|uniref:KIB1-4 beta-propeller domain-containing protein n=1 Tax=Sesamum angolense TaxID=2727404 RepID=A0AAE1WCL1_9LAMI|nr:hypothetical protein Sango_2149700 [Sesamum angolense]
MPMVKYINVVQQIDGDMQYLVDAMGDLLLVSRYLDFEIDIEHYLEVCKTVKFRVYRFDWNAQKWESMASLDDKVVFLGRIRPWLCWQVIIQGVKGIGFILQMTILGQIMIVLLGIMTLVFIIWRMGVLNHYPVIPRTCIGQFGSLQVYAKHVLKFRIGSQFKHWILKRCTHSGLGTITHQKSLSHLSPNRKHGAFCEPV